MPLHLESCTFARMPLRYGSETCCLVLGDSKYTADIVALRNDPDVNRFIHHGEFTEDDHERWLISQTNDALNFVALVHGGFAGTASLYDIEPSVRCQYGRVVMPPKRRVFAVAIEFLCLSFAFEVLHVAEVYCRVHKDNYPVYDFHLRNGWKRDSRYDEIANDVVLQNGMSMSIETWPANFKNAQSILQRLHRKTG